MSECRVNFFQFDSQKNQDANQVVVVAHYRNKWVLVRHSESGLLELAGGIRSQSETLVGAARRILGEEIGASRFHLVPVETYQVDMGLEGNSSGVVFYAEVEKLSEPWNRELVFIEENSSVKGPMGSHLPLFERVLLKTQILQRAKPYRHVIWDWNGTLIDDVELAVKVAGVLLEENQLPAITLPDYKESFGFPVIDYYERIGFDLERHCFNALSDRFHEEYGRYRLSHSQLFQDVHWQLEFLAKSRKQSILSAAAQWHLDEWVKHHQVDHHFDHIFGIDNHYAGSKLERGRELIEKSRISPSQTLLIGDTDHDLQVANELGIDALLIADGHQSFNKLSQLHHNVLESRYL